MDIDLHAAWQSSDLPAVPPCVATKPSDIRILSIDYLGTSEPSTHGSCTVDYLFHPNLNSHQGFPWTGPDPLSPMTQADDLFLYLSAFLLPEEVTWVEFRLSRRDAFSDDFLEEYLFFVPRTETAMVTSVAYAHKSSISSHDLVLQLTRLVSDCLYGHVWTLYRTHSIQSYACVPLYLPCPV